MRCDVAATPEIAQEQNALRDKAVRRIVEATPDQIAAWIEANVNNLADAKAVLKAFAKVLVILARRTNR